jgi:hypothetical protein
VDERGQASIEWLGLVALIAVLATTMTLAFGGGTAIGQGVVRQFRRALCIVSAGVCDLDQRPCVVASSETTDDGHVNLAVLRLGRDTSMLVEHRSDGSVLVTAMHDTSAGLEVGEGDDFWLRAAGLDLSGGSSVRAALLASMGGGQSWLFPDELSANAGMTALSDGQTPAGGQRTEVMDRKGLEALLDAQGEHGHVSGEIHLDARIVDGAVVDPRTGNRTVVITMSGSAAATGVLSLGDDVGDLQVDAGAAGEVRVAVTSDATGRALELAVVRTGQLDGAASLPNAVQPIAKQLLDDAQDGRSWVVAQHLDLTDPENLQAARSLVDALRGSPVERVLAAAGAALNGRLAQAGVIEAQTYGTRSEDGGFGLHIAVKGLRFGGGFDDHTDRTTLLDARVRDDDGIWRTRTDCLPANAG